MTPLAPLRNLFLGLLGWLVLGVGIYFLWEWADGVDPPERLRPTVILPVERPSDRPTLADRTAIERNRIASAQQNAAAERNRDRQGGWPYLVTGLVLVGTSLGGGLPVVGLMALLRRRPRADRRGRIETVSRPDGSKLHVEIMDNENAPTLLLTHGWSLDSTEWFYVKEALADKYRIVVWDLAGLGRSTASKSHPLRIENMAADLEAVLQQTCPRGPVVLVGHSIGGMTIQTFCRLYPQHLGSRVVGLCLVHTTYTNPLKTALFAPLWKALEKPLIVPLNYLTIALAPLFYISNWQSYLNGSQHLASRITSFAGTQTLSQIDYSSLMATCAWPSVFGRGNLAMLKFDEEATLRTISVPTLIVGGENDRLTKFSASQHLAAKIPQGDLRMLEPAGHLGHWEQHDDFTQMLDRFVTTLSVVPAEVA